MGLIKIDLLSQRSLAVLRDTLNSLEKGTKGVKNVKVHAINSNAEPK